MTVISYKGLVTPLERYLKDLSEIRASGLATDETSFYTPLNNLLDDIGGTFRPRVKCVMQLKNLYGAGHPDGGLFLSPDQFQKTAPDQPVMGQKPARGAIEAKPTDDDAFVTAEGDQVTKYWREYGQVLVTNYRDFVLVGRDSDGKPVNLGYYRLAADEDSFWAATEHPRKTAEYHESQFSDFLKLAVLSPAILVDPKDVAEILAYYARQANARVQQHSYLHALETVRTALEQALGLKFEGDKGDHFFRSSLVQTLFYGIFSAWVLWSKKHSEPEEKFDWRLAQWSLRVPMIRALFEQIATPGQLGALGLVEILDWTASALNRVNRGEFRKRFQDQHAVQYFYEPFLKAFDPILRKQLGVWFTPTEIVQYMVARTDQVLREELKLADGLADKNVYILDPACGTGAYLVEVLKTIAATLEAKGEDALFAEKLKHIAMERVFGFEILPAPFVVSHLQLGLLLQNLGAPFGDEKGERAAVYLTNSLTGWEPPKDAKVQLTIPEMQDEREAADGVKRGDKILVVIGNPPYNAFAGVSPEEEEGLVEVYKGKYTVDKLNPRTGKTVKNRHGQPVQVRRYRLNDPKSRGGWGIKKFNLDDLYVRFFRLAERRIAEMTGRGVVCYISNHSYITEKSYVILREHLFASFNKIWIDNLHGDRKRSEYGPDGRTSETVFAMPGFSPGIKQGVATTLWVKTGEKKPASVFVRDDIDSARASDRRKQLLKSLEQEDFANHYVKASPTKDNLYSFWPTVENSAYKQWPTVVDLFRFYSNGLMEKRAGALIDDDKLTLARRMKAYFDPGLSWEKYKALRYGLERRPARFGEPSKVRTKALKAEGYEERRLVRYSLRPFDERWAYYTGVRPIWNEPRPQLWEQFCEDNLFLATRPAGVASPEGVPFYATAALGDNDALRGHAYYFPISLRAKKIPGQLFEHLQDSDAEPEANLSQSSKNYLHEIGSPPDKPEQIWFHVLAMGFSPLYLSENADGIRRNWPRIPLPMDEKLLKVSADLGRLLVSLLESDLAADGITSGTLRPEIAVIGNVGTMNEVPLNSAVDLKITKGWGHKAGNVVNPGKGKTIERDYTTTELDAFANGAAAIGLTLNEALARLGSTTCDVYLNDRAYWKNIPTKVWEFYLGGFQVIKKWLSYREFKILGKAISIAEADHVRDIARRLAAICLLGPRLDENYTASKGATYAWLAPPEASLDTVGR